AARGQRQNAQHAYLPAERKGDGASDPNFLACLEHTMAVEPDVALLYHPLGQGATLHQPDAVQVAIDPHFFLSFASSAKACDGLERRSRLRSWRRRQRPWRPPP